MDLGAMKTQFSGLLKRRDNTSTLTDTFFANAIMRVQRDLRCPAMEKKIIVTITNGVTYDGGIAIPGDFLELKSIRLFDSAGTFIGKIEGRDEDDVFMRARTMGLPEFYTRDGGKWVFGPGPEDGHIVHITYWSDLGLDSDSASHVLTSTASDLFIYGALSYAADYYMDKRRDTWEARFTDVLASIQDQADLDEMGSQAVSPAYSLCED